MSALLTISKSFWGLRRGTRTSANSAPWWNGPLERFRRRYQSERDNNLRNRYKGYPQCYEELHREIPGECYQNSMYGSAYKIDN